MEQPGGVAKVIFYIYILPDVYYQNYFNFACIACV
jgi:hypothetical protein